MIHETSEHEVANELQQSRLLAHQIQPISSDPGSEVDEHEIFESKGKESFGNFENDISDERVGRHKQGIRRPTQTFSSPLGRFSHNATQGGDAHVSGSALMLLLFPCLHPDDSLPTNDPPSKNSTNLPTT